MKKGLGRFKLLAVLALTGALFTGCGGSASQSEGTTDAAPAQEEPMAMDYASDDIYNAGVVTEEAAAEEASEIAEEGTGNTGTPEVQDTQRKLIRNVSLEVETETFDELLVTVNERTGELGGYIEESYTYNGSNYYGRDLRNANLTIRIPAEKLDAFLSAVSEISNVISRNESVTDVTLQYVDMESHKKVLLAEQERLLELLERAETIEDIISLESRLSEVRYQIESMESQLRTMDNQVSYSTVYLYINEVSKLTPVKEQTVWEKISTGFANSVYQVGSGLLNFGIGFVIALPYILFWAAVILIFVLIIRGIIGRKNGKNGRESQKARKKRGAEPDPEHSLQAQAGAEASEQRAEQTTEKTGKEDKKDNE